VKKFCFFVLIPLLFLFSCSQQEGNDKISAPANTASPLKVSSLWDSLIPSKMSKSALDNIAVEVNGKQLLASKLEQQTAAILGKMKFDNDKERQEQEGKIKKYLINNFIVRVLLEEEIEQQKISIPANIVEAEIEKIKANLPASISFDDFLKSRSLTYSALREEVEFGLKIAKIVERHRLIQVTEREIEDFYKKNKDKFVSPELAKIRHILIAAPPNMPAQQRETKRALAEDLKKQIDSGTDFAALARNFSDCPSKDNGGELGYLSREGLEENFAKAAFTGRIGEFSNVVETSFGFHIIQVLDKRPAAALPLDGRLRPKIANFITQQKQMESFEEIIKKLKDKAEIKINQ